MSIKILQDIFDGKGEQFITNLLNLECKVTEKINGSKFSFEHKDGDCVFFKRDVSNPISKIDRILSKFYEDAIEHFESLDHSIKDELPENYRFYFQYFPDSEPNIVCNTKPINKLILTHILSKKDDKDLDSKDVVISSKKELDEWADKLQVGKPPCIFEGKLSDKQKDSLMEYLRMTKEDVLKKFKTDSFSKYLIGILDPDLKTTVLDPTIDEKIEGVVFSFGDLNYQVLAKILDPYFEQVHKNETPQKNDMSSIIFSDIIEFVEQDTSWQKMKLRKVGVNDRYIELISRMYNTFIDNFGYKYQDINLNLPTYLKQPKFDLNIDFIENQKTILYINKSIPWKEIFKMFIALFRKKRSKVQDFLPPKIIKFQNNLVDQIYKKIISIDENFADYDTTLINEFYIENDVQNSQTDVVPDIPQRLIEENVLNEVNNENDSHMRVLSFWQKAFTIPESEDVEVSNVKRKGVNVIVGKFQPFNNNHLKSCKELYEKNHKPIVILQIHNGQKTENKPFDKELCEKMLTAIVNDNKIFDSFHIIKNSSQNSINEILENQYPIIILGNEKLVRYFKKSYDFNTGVDKKTEFKELDKYIIEDEEILNKDILETIKNDDYMLFKKYIPKPIHGYFLDMKNKMK